MSFREKVPTSPKSPLRRRRRWSWSGSWLNHPTTSLKQVVSAVIQSQSPRSMSKPQSDFSSAIDRTLSLPDSLLLKILQKLPESQNNDVSLVCKRWLNLQGRRVRTLKLLDLDFLLSGKLVSRFPKLTNVDFSNACINPPRNPAILLCHKSISFHVSSIWDFLEENLFHSDMVDSGLRVLGRGSCDLLKLLVINATELGLLGLAEQCSHLQELELHKCNDNLLRGIASCENLRALRLVGSVDGLYTSIVSDIGLTILAAGCKRLVKLELSGCEGSFDGIKAIGQCCELLQELSVCDHRMDDGWIGALSCFESLKTLRIWSCRNIDPCPGPEKLLGSCPALESLQLKRCCLNDKDGVRALFKVCDGATKVHIQDCWGLDDDSFSLAKAFRMLSPNNRRFRDSGSALESMRVVSCKNIKDGEISPALSSLFSLLKELTWRPDTRSHLSSRLQGAGIGKRGSKFFKRDDGMGFIFMCP